MATKKTGARKVQATVKKDVIRHARVELPEDDYTAVKEVAKSNGLSVAAYIRRAILQRVRRDRAETEGDRK
jgi:predicted DNA binding CopG/RHH family protein